MEMQREMQNRRGNEEMKNKENKEKQVDANWLTFQRTHCLQLQAWRISWVSTHAISNQLSASRVHNPENSALHNYSCKNRTSRMKIIKRREDKTWHKHHSSEHGFLTAHLQSGSDTLHSHILCLNTEETKVVVPPWTNAALGSPEYDTVILGTLQNSDKMVSALRRQDKPQSKLINDMKTWYWAVKTTYLKASGGKLSICSHYMWSWELGRVIVHARFTRLLFNCIIIGKEMFL
jgi:hypothetical protein